MDASTLETNLRNLVMAAICAQEKITKTTPLHELDGIQTELEKMLQQTKTEILAAQGERREP